MNSRVTLSVFKADVGGFVGHGSVHPDMLQKAKDTLKQDGKELLIDFYVTNVGDDINLVLTHREGVDAEPIHTLAWNTFRKCTEVAKDLKMYGAGQDLLSDAFSGNIKGMGPELQKWNLKSGQASLSSFSWQIKPNLEHGIFRCIGCLRIPLIPSAL